MHIHTVGHGNLSSQALLERLVAHGIEALVDVRRTPFSGRHPHFCRAALESDLAPRGIAYVHEPALGGRREAHVPSTNGGLEDAGLRAYADHMANAEYAAARDRLTRLARARAVAVLCAESDPDRCHRSLLADDLALRGFTVLHVLDVGTAREHVPHAAARAGTDGVVGYPARGPVQGELFA